MSAKINQYFYPYIGQVKDLPVYLAGIGGTEFQEHISRPEAGIRYFSLPKAAERLNLMICPLRSPTDASFSCLHIIPTNIIPMIRDGTCVG